MPYKRNVCHHSIHKTLTIVTGWPFCPGESISARVSLHPWLSGQARQSSIAGGTSNSREANDTVFARNPWKACQSGLSLQMLMFYCSKNSFKLTGNPGAPDCPNSPFWPGSPGCPGYPASPLGPG